MGESDPTPLPTLDTDCNSTRTANLAPPSPADSAGGGGGGRGDISRAPLVAAVGGHDEDVRTTFDERAHRPLGSADIPRETHKLTPDGVPIDLSSAPLLEIDDAGPQEPPPPPPIALPTPAPTPPPPASSPALPTVRVLPGPTYPQLSNNPPSSPGTRLPLSDDKDEEPSVPKSFDRTAQSGGGAGARQKYYEEAETAEYAVRRMHRFTLYETTTRYYIVGSDLLDQQFRIIKIDRTADEGELSIIEDEVIYTRAEMMRLLATIEDGNIATGGLKQRCPFWGLLGFIRFTGMYYMLLITKRSVVAMIGGHYVYQIDDTEMVPLTTSAAPKKPDRNSEEARFVSILGNLDLTRGFYFSYSYDITRTLQHNIIRQREALEKGLAHSDKHDYNDMFAWNHYLLEPAKEGIKNTYDWCMPIVHGYVDQANIAVYGRSLYITIIARRSRYFAGARFLKRGANDLGYVANDVETEQIVSEMLTTSFHAPGRTLYTNPNYTSYVQHRGSIPLFWTQKNDAATPKPPVEMNLVDPFFSAAALHFDDLFGRYGAPVIVLNLVKSRERMPRESLLLKEFTQAINYLNQFLPDDKHIHYIAWDMSRAAKSRDQDVIETLETIAENVVSTTGFFHNGAMNGINRPKLQNGVCRTNCIDCLDRTNAAQFVIGKRALGHQLHALGVIDGTSINYDTDAVDLFTHMYHDHGDTIAVQYAGSHLVNTMETYRKINQWSSHSRDMLESFKRYYNNSFLDGQRQEAYNLFLGNYIFAQGQPMLWDLSTDYYLHHADPRLGRKRRSYTQWWTPAHLAPRKLPNVPKLPPQLAGKPYHYFDDYWLEYYRPRAVSSFLKVFTYNLNSTLRYIPLKQTKDGKYDLSPFVVRTAAAATEPHEQSSKKKYKRRGIIEFPGFREKAEVEASDLANKTSAVRHWPVPDAPVIPTSTIASATPIPADLPPESRNMHQAVERSLKPQISQKERAEYQRYMAHPQHLPLVTSSAPSARDVQSGVVAEYKGYVDIRVPPDVSDEDSAIYREAVEIPENPLDVATEDRGKKRYMAYAQWVATGRLKRQGGGSGGGNGRRGEGEG